LANTNPGTQAVVDRHSDILYRTHHDFYAGVGAVEQSSTMMIIADTHVHFYQDYQLGVFRRIAARMDKTADGAGHANILCMAERLDCHWFQDLKNGRLDLPADYSVKSLPSDPAAVVLTVGADCRLFLLAGRQIVTVERLEILALSCDGEFRNGASAADTIEEILKRGGVPVLAWAPGKWMFRRGDVVAELIRSFTPERLLLCDPAIRPALFREPSLMRLARSKGLKVICGSDPLPLHGEEELIGTWCSTIEGNFDASQPAKSMSSLLLAGSNPVHQAGRRCGLFTALLRLASHRIRGK